MAREYIPKLKYIRPEVWKRITSVINDYHVIKCEFEHSKKSIKNYSKVRFDALRLKVWAFEKAWENSDIETQKIIRLHFWDKKAYREIMLPASESTMKRNVKKFIENVGQTLGELD